MPIYDKPQAGSNPDLAKNVSSLDVGQSYTMFDGSETPAEGLKSVAFSRAAQASSDNGTTFNASEMPDGMVIDVQVAARNIDGDFTTVQSLTGSAGSPDSGNAAYTDVGRSCFYRLFVSAYTSGDMPIVIANR